MSRICIKVYLAETLCIGVLCFQKIGAPKITNFVYLGSILPKIVAKKPESLLKEYGNYEVQSLKNFRILASYPQLPLIFFPKKFLSSQLGPLMFKKLRVNINYIQGPKIKSLDQNKFIYGHYEFGSCMLWNSSWTKIL